MWKARELREMAMKGRNLEKAVNSQDSTIDLLETSIQATHQFYWNQLADERKKLERQKENTVLMENFAASHREEADYYRKKYRKQRRQKGLLTAGMAVLIGLIIVK